MEYVIIFIIIYHIYLLLYLYSKSDKNYIQTIKSVKFLGGIPQTTAKTLIYKRKTSELFNIPEFCFIISQYSYGLNFFLPVDLKHYVYVYVYLKI